MAYAYTVHLARREPDSRELAPAEHIGRIAANNLQEALQEAEERYRGYALPWQGLVVRRLFFDTTGLTITHRGACHYLQPREE